MANLQIDTSKSAAANLLAILNAGNTTQLTQAQFTAGTPAVKSDSGDGRNTTLVLTAVAGQGYSGTVSVTYARLGLGSGVASPDYTLTANTGDTAAAIVTALATKLGLVATELHLEDPANPGTPLSGAQTTKQATLNLVSATGSLLYVDASTQAITMTWNDPALSSAVTTTALPGFATASGTGPT